VRLGQPGLAREMAQATADVVTAATASKTGLGSDQPEATLESGPGLRHSRRHKSTMAARPKLCILCRAPIPEARRRFRARFCSSKCRCKAAQSTYKRTPKGKAKNSSYCATYHRKSRRGSHEYRAYRLRLNRGIVFDNYPVMLAAQNGGCAKCGSPPPDGGHLYMEVDRATKTVKRLICAHCNASTIAQKRYAGYTATSRSSLRRAKLASAMRVPRQSG
jgi:hypothetical protein